jgi:hypothetical protein
MNLWLHVDNYPKFDKQSTVISKYRDTKVNDYELIII